MTTNEDFDGGMKQMWVGIKGVISKRAGNTDKGISTLIAKNGNKIVSRSRGKGEVLVEHYRKLGTPKRNNRFDTELEIEINKSANAKVEESKREDSSCNELQREFTSDEVKECVAKLKNRNKAAGADEILYSERIECEGMTTIIRWISKNEYTFKRWREGVVVNLFKKGGITLLSTTVGKIFCRILKDRVRTVLKKE